MEGKKRGELIYSDAREIMKHLTKLLQFYLYVIVVVA